MTANEFGELLGGDRTLDAISNALIAFYGWAREWQILLAGLLVLVAALILARTIRRASLGRGSQIASLDDARLDLRLAPRPAGATGWEGELIGELEQLRSLIRSALSAFTLTAEKENSPVQFLCQRVARLRPDRFPPAPGSAKNLHDQYAALLEQLEVLRQQLKKEAQPLEISGTLVQLNTSARTLIAALAPQSAPARRHSELR